MAELLLLLSPCPTPCRPLVASVLVQCELPGVARREKREPRALFLRFVSFRRGLKLIPRV